MGVDSGLPDFRGAEGFWNAYPPFRERGLSFQDLASPRWFERDPALAWGFYGHRLGLYRSTAPHAGYDILLRWARAKRRGFFVFTSNVDGAFEKAGFPQQQILEAHGSIHHLQHAHRRDGPIFDGAKWNVEVDEATFRAVEPLPRDEAGKLLRPNILMFGDSFWNPERSEQQWSNYARWLEGCGSPLIIELGAGRAVPTVRREGEKLTRLRGAKLLRINPRESGLDGAPGTSISAGALESLKEIDRLTSH